MRQHQKKTRLMKSDISLSAIPIIFWTQYLLLSCIVSIIKIEDVSTKFSRIQWIRLILCGALVEWPKSTHTKHPPIVLNYTEMSGNKTREMITISYLASLWPQIVIIQSDSNEPTMAYVFGRQLPFIPPSLKDLNLPPNQLNRLATMAVASPTEEGHDKNYIPQSPEPSEPSTISTPPLNLSTIDGWETPHTTRDDITFYSEDKPRRIWFLPSIPSSPPPRKLKRKLSFGVTIRKRGGVSQHVCVAWRQSLPVPKDKPGLSSAN